MCVCVAVCALGGGSGRQIESSLLERGTMRPQPLSYLLFLLFSFPFFSFPFSCSLSLFPLSLLLFPPPFKTDSQSSPLLCIFLTFSLASLILSVHFSFNYLFFPFNLPSIHTLFSSSFLSICFLSSDNVSPAETPSTFSFCLNTQHTCGHTCFFTRACIDCRCRHSALQHANANHYCYPHVCPLSLNSACRLFC